MHGGDDGLLDLGAAVAVGRVGERGEVELLRVALALCRWIEKICAAAPRGRAGRRRRSRRTGPCAAVPAAALRCRWRWRSGRPARVCSCIQVSSVPNMRLERPPSELWLAAEAKPFSISSIQRTTGAIRSAWRSASRSRRSDSPMYRSYSAPTSSRSSGRCQAVATALAARLLPAPCTPSIRTPRRRRQAESRAASVSQHSRRCSSHCLSRPARRSRRGSTGDSTYSSRPVADRPALAARACG